MDNLPTCPPKSEGYFILSVLQKKKRERYEIPIFWMQPCCLTFAHNTGSVAFLWKTRPQQTVVKNEVDIK